MVVFLRSWKKIDDMSGSEAVDFAESTFLNLCRSATREAAVHTRLSNSVFAAFWSAAGAERFSLEVFQRWLPMEIKAPQCVVPIDAAWFVAAISPGDSARDVFDRIAAEVEGSLGDLPANERFDPLSGGWDRQT